MVVRIISTILHKGVKHKTFPVPIHDISSSFHFLNVLPYSPHISPKRRDNKIFVIEISFLLEEFLIIPNSYFHTMRIFLSYGCVLLLHFTLFVCPMFFSYNVLIKSIYLFLYLFIFFSSLLFTNVSHFHLVKICFNQLEHTFPSLCILHHVLIYNLKYYFYEKAQSHS